MIRHHPIHLDGLSHDEIDDLDCMGYSICWHHYHAEWIGRCLWICFECGHVYKSRHELRRMRRKNLRGLYGPLRARLRVRYWIWATERIDFCPHCLHDF